MEKKAVERAKRVFHTALHMLRDLDAIDQKGVKNISEHLETVIRIYKKEKEAGLVKKEGMDVEQPVKNYEGIK